MNALTHIHESYAGQRLRALNKLNRKNTPSAKYKPAHGGHPNPQIHSNEN